MKNSFLSYLLLVCFSSLMSCTPSNNTQDNAILEEPLHPEITQLDQIQARHRVLDNEECFRDWLAFYESAIPGLLLNQFKQQDSFLVEGFLNLVYQTPLAFEKLVVRSPNEAYYLDVVSYGRSLDRSRYGTNEMVTDSPDDSAIVIDVETGEAQRILFCGTPCVFQDGCWLSDHEILVAGLGSHDTFNYQPTLWYVNLLEKEVIVYSHPKKVNEGSLDYLQQRLQ